VCAYRLIIRNCLIRENDHPGNVFPGKKPSGKVTIRETTVNRIEVLIDTVMYLLIIAFVAVLTRLFCRRFGVAVLTMNLSAVVLGQCRCSAHYKPIYMYY